MQQTRPSDKDEDESRIPASKRKGFLFVPFQEINFEWQSTIFNMQEGPVKLICDVS